MVVALEPGEDKVEFFLPDRCGKISGRAQWIELREIIVGDVNGTIRAFRKRFLDGLLHALRTHREDHHLAAVLLFQAQGFFKGIAVRLVHLETNVGFLDPVSGHGEWSVFRRDLLNTDNNVHGVPLEFYGWFTFTGSFEARRKRRWAEV